MIYEGEATLQFPLWSSSSCEIQCATRGISFTFLPIAVIPRHENHVLKVDGVSMFVK